MAITPELIEKKLKCAYNDHRVSTDTLRILASVQQAVHADDVKAFRKSVVQPLVRRQAKAAQAIVFWSNPEAVREWVEQDAMRESAALESLEAWKARTGFGTAE